MTGTSHLPWLAVSRRKPQCDRHGASGGMIGLVAKESRRQRSSAGRLAGDSLGDDHSIARASTIGSLTRSRGLAVDRVGGSQAARRTAVVWWLWRAAAMVFFPALWRAGGACPPRATGSAAPYSSHSRHPGHPSSSATEPAYRS